MSTNSNDRPSKRGEASPDDSSGYTDIFIGLGSNLGDRHSNLSEAIERLARLELRITRVSSIYETEPVGYADQPWFLNQVIGCLVEPFRLPALGPSGQVESTANPAIRSAPSIARELLLHLLGIETEMGRDRTISNGPRIIDLDLLLFDTLILKSEDESDPTEYSGPALTIPHPRMHLRRFVLEPLCEIAPEAVHPVFNKSSCELLAHLTDNQVVRRWTSGSG